MISAGLQVGSSPANSPIVPKHFVILQSGEIPVLILNESSFEANLVFSFSEEAANEGTHCADVCQAAPGWLQ